MSNNYTKFAAEPIMHLTAEELAWLKERLELRLEEMEDEEYEKAEELLGFYINVDDNPWPSFSWDIEGGETAKHLYIYEDEAGSGAFGNATKFLSAFLQKFRPTLSVVISWTDFGDKNTVDDNGGGAIYLKGSIVESMSTFDWVESMREKYER